MAFLTRRKLHVNGRCATYDFLFFFFFYFLVFFKPFQPCNHITIQFGHSSWVMRAFQIQCRRDKFKVLVKFLVRYVKSLTGGSRYSTAEILSRIRYFHKRFNYTHPIVFRGWKDFYYYFGGRIFCYVYAKVVCQLRYTRFFLKISSFCVVLVCFIPGDHYYDDVFNYINCLHLPWIYHYNGDHNWSIYHFRDLFFLSLSSTLIFSIMDTFECLSILLISTAFNVQVSTINLSHLFRWMLMTLIFRIFYCCGIIVLAITIIWCTFVSFLPKLVISNISIFLWSRSNWRPNKFKIIKKTSVFSE